MNKLTAEITLPCGCALAHTFTDVDPLPTTLERTRFLLFAGQVLTHWFTVRVEQHECPNDLPCV